MKRTVGLALASILVAAAGCNRGTEPPPPIPTAPAAPAAPGAPAAPTTPAAPGTPAAGTAVAGEPIADFPDYPGATRTGYEIGTPTAPHTKEVEAKFITSDTFQNVVAHYQQLITSGGWTPRKQQVKATEAEWTLVKGTSEVEIDVEQKPGGVQISIERKD